MISVTPSYPGVGYSSKVPIEFANVSRNSPSAGSSGIITRREP